MTQGQSAHRAVASALCLLSSQVDEAVQTFSAFGVSVIMMQEVSHVHRDWVTCPSGWEVASGGEFLMLVGNGWKITSSHLRQVFPATDDAWRSWRQYQEARVVAVLVLVAAPVAAAIVVGAMVAVAAALVVEAVAAGAVVAAADVAAVAVVVAVAWC